MTCQLISSMSIFLTWGVTKILPRLCGCCGGAVDSIIMAFAQLHRLGFSLEFEALYEPIQQVAANLWQRIGKISGRFKNSTFIVVQQCQNKVSFQRKGTIIVSKFSLHLLK